MKKEFRCFSTEFRALEGGVIEGYALKFNELSNDLGGFREIILSGSLDGVLDRSDIVALFNHDSKEVPMARYRGVEVRKDAANTLELTVDEVGLFYRFTVPESNKSLYDAIARGDIDASSFAFTVDPMDTEVVREGDQIIRKIKRFSKLFDVSPVTRPAYEQTAGLAVRSQDVEDFEKREHAELQAEFDKRDWGQWYKEGELSFGKRCREITNGFIVTTFVCGYDGDNNWIYKESEEYFEADPLTNQPVKEETVIEKEALDSYYNSLMAQFGFSETGE